MVIVIYDYSYNPQKRFIVARNRKLKFDHLTKANLFSLFVQKPEKNFDINILEMQGIALNYLY